jgi:hypothetical protein
MVILLNKATPMPGMSLWWNKPFQDAPEIPVEEFSSRNANGLAFAEAWKDAHQQFQEKIQHRRAGTDFDSV